MELTLSAFAAQCSWCPPINFSFLQLTDIIKMTAIFVYERWKYRPENLDRVNIWNPSRLFQKINLNIAKNFEHNKESKWKFRYVHRDYFICIFGPQNGNYLSKKSWNSFASKNPSAQWSISCYDKKDDQIMKKSPLIWSFMKKEDKNLSSDTSMYTRLAHPNWFLFSWDKYKLRHSSLNFMFSMQNFKLIVYSLGAM